MSSNADKKLDRTQKPRDSDQKFRRKRKPAPSPKVSHLISGAQVPMIITIFHSQDDKDAKERKNNASMSSKMSPQWPKKVELEQVGIRATTSNEDSVSIQNRYPGQSEGKMKHTDLKYRQTNVIWTFWIASEVFLGLLIWRVSYLPWLECPPKRMHFPK